MRSPLSNTLLALALTLSLSALGSATPAPAPAPAPGNTALLPRSGPITPEQIIAIAPKATSCAEPPAPGECATAEQAAPLIAHAFETYQITARAEQAAVLALMAFESGEFKYNRNHFPGVPGQGTRNMQSPAFNAKYAAALPKLADDLARVAGDPAGVLDLLLADEEYDFGSGAWFLTTQCTPQVRAELQSGSQAGWESYITACVGTEANAERRAYWTRALQALEGRQCKRYV